MLASGNDVNRIRFACVSEFFLFDLIQFTTDIHGVLHILLVFEVVAFCAIFG